MNAAMDSAIAALARMAGTAKTRCRLCGGAGATPNWSKRGAPFERCGQCDGSGYCAYPVSDLGTWVGNATRDSEILAERLAEGLRPGPVWTPPSQNHESREANERACVGLYVPAEHLAGWESGAWPEKRAAS